MNTSEYQAWCRRFDNHLPSYANISLALGLCSEAGEVAAHFEKWCRAGNHELDLEAIALELGDVLWNVARMADQIGYTLEELMTMNINKLVKRYETRGIALSPATDSSAAVVYEERGLDLR